MLINNRLAGYETSVPRKPLEKSGWHLRILILFLSTLYAYVTVVARGEDTADYQEYLDYISNSPSIIVSYIEESLSILLFNEPVWLLINGLLGYFFEKEQAVAIIVATSSFVTANVLLSNNKRYLLFFILFFCLPQVWKNNVEHVRQGLAVCFFVLSWYSTNGLRRSLFLCVAPLVHASFFIVFIVLLFETVLRRLKNSKILKVGLHVTFGLILGLSLQLVTELLGARQASSHNFIAAEGSGAGFVIWSAGLALFLLSGRKFLDRHFPAVSIIIFYLTTYFLVEAAVRVFESAFFVVFLAILDLEKHWRFAFLTLFVLFSLLAGLRRIVVA